MPCDICENGNLTAAEQRLIRATTRFALSDVKVEQKRPSDPFWSKEVVIVIRPLEPTHWDTSTIVWLNFVIRTRTFDHSDMQTGQPWTWIVIEQAA